MPPICSVCGQENPEGARFCNNCAAPLGAEHETSREERKVVTVFFADLVGFTGRAEQLDPEDVRGMLSPYYARACVRRSSASAAPWRRSSATPSWPSSGRPRCTRTTPSAPSARR